MRRGLAVRPLTLDPQRRVGGSDTRARIRRSNPGPLTPSASQAEQSAARDTLFTCQERAVTCVQDRGRLASLDVNAEPEAGTSEGGTDAAWCGRPSGRRRPGVIGGQRMVRARCGREHGPAERDEEDDHAGGDEHVTETGNPGDHLR